MPFSRGAVLKWSFLVVALLVVGALGWTFLAPKPSQVRDDPAPAAATLLREGSFRDGDRLHKASGTVQLLSDEKGYLLHFADYEATPGPDVYFYLTREAGASTTEAVERDGIRLRTSTGTGQATLRGGFNVRIPEGIDPTGYAGISIWCDSWGRGARMATCRTFK